MSKRFEECPLSNEMNCKYYGNDKLCAMYRKDRTCQKKTNNSQDKAHRKKPIPGEHLESPPRINSVTSKKAGLS